MTINRIEKDMLAKEVSEKLDSINLTSPDGSKWIISISNTGVITATKKTT